MKIRPVGTEMLHADRLTDKQKEDNSGFSQFCESVLKLNWIMFVFSLNYILVMEEQTSFLLNYKY